LRAVISDLFETLITEWGKVKYTSQAVANDLGVTEHDLRRESAALQKQRYSGEISDTVQYYKIILQRLGVTRDESLLHKVFAKREASKKKCFEAIDPEIINLLQTLKEKGYKTGLISNCSTEEITGLKACQLYAYLDVAVLSCDVGLIKPDKQIYEYAASLLQVNPAECFFIGDGGSDELNGAKAAGMTPLKASWYIKHFADNPESIYPSFMSIDELKKFLC